MWMMTYGGSGESLVPPHTRGGFSLSLSVDDIVAGIIGRTLREGGASVAGGGGGHT